MRAENAQFLLCRPASGLLLRHSLVQHSLWHFGDDSPALLVSSIALQNQSCFILQLIYVRVLRMHQHASDSHDVSSSA